MIMETKRIEKLKAYIKENTEYLNAIDFVYAVKNEDYSNIDELSEIILENYIYTEEVIYYSRAMEFLKENDPSMQVSLWLASDIGYDCENLNSELLATLLLQEFLLEEWNENLNEIEEILFN